MNESTTSTTDASEVLPKVTLAKLTLIFMIAAVLGSVAIAAILAASGHTTITARSDGAGVDGILYYPPKPYFIVFPREESRDRAKEAGIDWRDLEFDRLYLPDLEKPHANVVISPGWLSNAVFTIRD